MAAFAVGIQIGVLQWSKIIKAELDPQSRRLENISKVQSTLLHEGDSPKVLVFDLEHDTQDHGVPGVESGPPACKVLLLRSSVWGVFGASASSD